MYIRLVLLLIALATRSSAQPWFSEIDVRTPGEVVWTSTVEADLNRDIPEKNCQITLLPPEFTGQGFRWEVEYSAYRTKSSWPGWAAMMRIDAPGANGECWNRFTTASINSETVTGTWVFHGDDHEEARPHRVRFTFSQPPSFPYRVSATVRCRRAPSANVGGKTRETPTWLRVGTQAAPSWITGELFATFEHRWMLMSVEAGQTLRVLARAGRDSIGKNAMFRIPLWNLQHRSLGSLAVIPSDTATSDTRLYVNNTGQRQWLIVGLLAGGAVHSFELGFYTPQGASPPVGSTVAAPTAAELNPYELVARDVKSFTGPSGSHYTMAVPGSGEMLRLRIRAIKTPFLTMGAGLLVRVKVIAEDGTVLHERSFTPNAYGIDWNDHVYELDDSTAPNRHPARIELSTTYAQGDVVADAIRYHRTR